MSMTRRDVLRATALGLAASACSGPSASTTTTPTKQPPPAPKKKILILGGTGFLGPATIAAAAARGHAITIFNRGKREKFRPVEHEVEHLYGNRDPELPADDEKGPDGKLVNPDSTPKGLEQLVGRTWDVVIDNSGFYPRMVKASAELLAKNASQYIYISSISAYDGAPAGGGDETYKTAKLADPTVETMGDQFQNYGGLKYLCEQAAATVFGDRATIVRPGYIVGPGDPTDRFTYWPARFVRGGECLAPGDPDNEVQFIDVRDLGVWIVHLIETATTGAFNAVGFDGRISVAEFLYTGKGTLNHTCSFTWVDDAFLAANGVTSWQEMGGWTPKAKNGRASNAKSRLAGATYRPIAETIRDTAAWVKEGRGERPWAAGMKAERERELLAKWKAR
ncbi:MAG: NAD-dependent epimerase/dehydratase family protein [Kofleriaceae bacterium]